MPRVRIERLTLGERLLREQGRAQRRLSQFRSPVKKGDKYGCMTERERELADKGLTVHPSAKEMKHQKRPREIPGAPPSKPFVAKPKAPLVPPEQLREEYANYRQTMQWKQKFHDVMVRDKNLCQWCLEDGRRAKAQVVHHLTYQHIFTEHLFELISLCHHCHEKYHGKTHRN